MIFLKFYNYDFTFTLAYNEILDGPLESYKNSKYCQIIRTTNTKTNKLKK